MKVILLENVKRIGSIGEVIDVKRGFARNFLIANKKALYASKENISQVEKIKNEMSKMGIENVYSATSPLDAIKTLEKNASISNNVIVSGSFELVGPIREFLLNSQGRL